jgi:hypothetical protein
MGVGMAVVLYTSTQVYLLPGEGHMSCNNEACYGLKFLSFETLNMCVRVCICVCVYVCVYEDRKDRKRINRFTTTVAASPAKFHSACLIKEKINFQNK